MSKKVHVVPHMHWDREWYFTAEESRILLVNNMEEIMDMLENNPNYPNYVLDGQTAILEDYFAAKPENKERVKKLVKEGRLIIGPWYTQTDEMVVGGESITRNLLYGLKDCEEFGDAMMIGYLPDSFGQSAQMPQILNGFGINRSIFWRGVSERMGTDKTEFYWEGDGDSKVLTQLFPLGYAIGKYLPSNMDDLKKRMDKYFPVLDKGATTENIILPNGHDQMPVQKNIFEILEKLRELYPERDFFLSRYEKVFEELEKEKNLPTLRGEFLDGKYMRVHRSIFSTRMDIKSANTRIENKITNILEPLASLAYSLGFEYHSGLIELIWKEIMKNHAHDSIGCCCSDNVHKEIMNRFFLAEEKVDRLIDFYMRVIVDAMSKEIALDKLTAFNLLPYEREVVVKGEIITKMKNFNLVGENGEEYDFQVINKEVVDAGLIDRQIVHYGNYDPFVRYTIELKDVIPSMGYKTYLIKETEGVINSEEGKKTDKVENKYFNITVNEIGSLNILHKDTNTLYENVLLIEDGADDGDEYDFSPLEDDFIVKSDLVKCKYSINTYENSSEIAINYTLDVPKDLESRKNKRIDGSMDISIIIKVDNCSPYLNVKMDIDNRAKDHKVRAYIPTGIKSNFSFSDNQFGVIKRDVYDSAMDVWEEENWDERPDSIYPMLSFVTLKNEERGMAVLTNSTREYEIIGQDYDTIAITLFRGVGFLGKEEMYRRPGRPSGIKLETPDSQMLGKVSLDFGIYPYVSSKDKVSRVAKEYLTPVYTYNKMPHNAMKLNSVDFETPYTYSLLKEENDDVTLSVLKKAENKKGLVLRYFNGTDSEKKVQFSIKGSNFKKVNLKEDVLENIEDFSKLNCSKNKVDNIYFELV